MRSLGTLVTLVLVVWPVFWSSPVDAASNRRLLQTDPAGTQTSDPVAEANAQATKERAAQTKERGEALIANTPGGINGVLGELPAGGTTASIVGASGTGSKRRLHQAGGESSDFEYTPPYAQFVPPGGYVDTPPSKYEGRKLQQSGGESSPDYLQYTPPFAQYTPPGGYEDTPPYQQYEG